jgi:hypothetical protein
MVIPSVYNEGIYNFGVYNITLSGSQVSIRLDGQSQYLGTINPAPLGVANTWTLGFWAKPFGNKEHAAIFSTVGDGSRNEISVSTTAIPNETQTHGKRPAELRVIIKDHEGTTIKHHGWGNYFQDDTWTHVFLQWDGTELNAFKNAVATTTGVALVTFTGTMADYPARNIHYGSSVPGVTATFSGILGHLGMWDSLLDPAEMGTVVSGGFVTDLTIASGSYSSQTNLKHYWKPGAEPADLGLDFAGNSSFNKQRNITSSNVTPETP